MVKKILLIVGITISILLVGVYFSYDYWLEKELRYKLSEIINKDPNSLYKYSFSKLNIHLIEGSVDLKGISVEPSEWAFDSLKSNTNDLRFILQLDMEHIELSGFEITEFITTGNIIVEALIITEPKFEYFFHPGKKQAAHAMPLSNLFSDKFKTAELGKLLINNAEIKMVDQTKSGPTVTVHQLNIELTKARIDSTTLQGFMPYKRENLSINAAGVSIDFAKDFSMKSDGVFFDVKEKSFGLINFQINPKYSKQNFAKMYDVQKQWFAIKVDSLILNHIDFDLFVVTGKLKVGKVEVVSPNIALYKDKSKPRSPLKRKLLPASGIKSIPWKIEIDSVAIKNGYVSIDETSSLTGKDSHLTFEELDALLVNFYNSSEKPNRSTIMKLSASTKVLGKAVTNLNMSFDLSSASDQFKVSGTVGKVEGKIFNSVLEPMMGVKVTGGTINKIDFNFTANDTLSIGTLDADYSGIKISVLRNDSTKTKNQKKGFMSLAANTVVKSNNSKKQTNYVQGIVKATRVQEKDVWPYLWHSIQAGLVSTFAPITNSKENRQQQKKVRQELKKARKGNR